MTRSGRHNGRLKPFAGLVVILCLALPAGAQEVSPELLQMALDAYRQQQEERQDPEILPAIKVDPKLVGKKVVVRERRGRHHRGELLEVGQGVTEPCRGGRCGQDTYRRSCIDKARQEDEGEGLVLSHGVGRDRSKAAGIGFLVGAAAGSVAAGIAIAKHGDFQAFSFVTVMAVSFGGAGAGFGALLAPKERTLIYQYP